MKNPLNKRYFRELKNDFGKYIALCLFLIVTIGFCSGFLVADGSTKGAYDESFEKYNIEDGHFILAKEADSSLIDKLEKENLSIGQLFYKDVDRKNNHTIRLYKNRTKVNKACLMDGNMPKADDEIAIDRLYGENNNIAIGDKIDIGNKDYKVTAYIALSDYSALFKNNTCPGTTKIGANGKMLCVIRKLTPIVNTCVIPEKIGVTTMNPTIIMSAPKIPIEKLSTNISRPGFTCPSNALSTCLMSHAPKGPMIIPPIIIATSAPITTPIVAIVPATAPRLPYTA